MSDTTPQGSTKIWFGVGRKASEPKDGAGVLFKFTDEFGDWYLLTKRAHFLTFAGTWANPGGSIDEGETPLEAAMRELEEELGVRAADVRGRIARVVECRDYKRLYTTYVVELDEDTIKVPRKLPAETADVVWYQPHEIADLNLHPNFRETWNAIK